MENIEFYDISGHPCSPSRAAVVEELRQMNARSEAERIRLARSNEQRRHEHEERVARRWEYE